MEGVEYGAHGELGAAGGKIGLGAYATAVMRRTLATCGGGHGAPTIALARDRLMRLRELGCSTNFPELIMVKEPIV